jgi:hypothetical protein
VPIARCSSMVAKYLSLVALTNRASQDIGDVTLNAGSTAMLFTFERARLRPSSLTPTSSYEGSRHDEVREEGHGASCIRFDEGCNGHPNSGHHGLSRSGDINGRAITGQGTASQL